MNLAQSSAGSLRGLRIAVTRARHQASPLTALIRKAGGLPVAYPCIAIEAVADSRPLDRELRRLGDFDWLAITSGNTARVLAERVAALQLKGDLTRLKIAVVGDGSRAELRRVLGRDADFTPAVYGAAALAAELPLAAGQRILLPQSDRADPAVARALKARGAIVTTHRAYLTVCASGGADLPAMLGRGEIAALTFASPSALTFFRRRCPLPTALELPAACIGPATAGAARQAGFRHVICPPKASLREMLRALGSHLRSPADSA